ncbi:putative hydro-lyase [Deferrisoma sp.]
MTRSATPNSPRELRRLCRSGEWTGSTAGLCPGHTQVNLVTVPAAWAFEFFLFCQRNPKPCPVLEVLEPGQTEPRYLAPGADVRTDCPRYRVFRGDEVHEVPNVRDVWRDDLVTFLLGCSFTFESALLEAGVPVRHVEMGRNVPMYETGIPCEPAGRFRGNLVVTMRPIPADLVPRAVQITSRFPGVHGAPVRVGDPAGLGITDLSRPDFGDPVDIREGEVPVFWACGVTPQVALRNARPELAITHAPGCMLVTDRMDREWAVF